MFVDGARTGLARQQTRPMVPIEWLRAHPLTKRWWGRALEVSVGAAFITRQMIDLKSGFEGYIRHLIIIGGWNQGNNDGRNWSVLVDGSAPIEMFLNFGGSVNQANFDLLPGGTDGINSWVELDLWIQENSLVSLTYNNNGGSTADQIGGAMYGYYWPISLRDEWVSRGWKK
jgi:hypothetical protein